MTAVMIAGVGGMGVVTAARVLAQTALSTGRDVKFYADYGMSRRGGAVVAHVRIDDVPVGHPIIRPGEADLLLGFELIECARALPAVKGGGVVIADKEIVIPSVVRPVAGKKRSSSSSVSREVLLGFIRERGLSVHVVDSRALCGDVRRVNMVMLGAGCASGALPFTREDLRSTIRTEFGGRAGPNLEAFDSGEKSIREGM